MSDSTHRLQFRDIGTKNSAYASYAVSEGNRYVDLVIGAHPDERCASMFSKSALADLIGKLQAIHDGLSELRP
jgi:hypothetical protein